MGQWKIENVRRAIKQCDRKNTAQHRPRMSFEQKPQTNIDQNGDNEDVDAITQRWPRKIKITDERNRGKKNL
jgi:hypothetical protein